MSDTNTGWDASALPRQIVRLMDTPKTLAQLSAELQVTDARVLWYLGKLTESGRVVEADGRWSRTGRGSQYAVASGPAVEDVTVIPGRTVYDFRQAYADAAAGMFGPDFVQGAGENGSRLSAAQAAEFRDRLVSLIAEYFAPGMGDRSGTKYGFHWVFTPTDLHPLDD